MITAETEMRKNAAFFQPPATILGLPLRPYAAGTEAQMENMRFCLRQRLNKLTGTSPEHLPACNESGCSPDCPAAHRSNLATYYFVGMFLYIHGADQREVAKACWDDGLFFEQLTSFLNRWRMAEVIGVMTDVAAIIEAANKMRDYQVEGGLDAADPNELSRDGLPAIPAQSSNSLAGV